MNPGYSVGVLAVGFHRNEVWKQLNSEWHTNDYHQLSWPTSGFAPDWLDWGSNNLIVQLFYTFQIFLDQMNQIMTVKQVILQGLWRSKRYIHHSTDSYTGHYGNWALKPAALLVSWPANSLARTTNKLCSGSTVTQCTMIYLLIWNW